MGGFPRESSPPPLSHMSQLGHITYRLPFRYQPLLKKCLNILFQGNDDTNNTTTTTTTTTNTNTNTNNNNNSHLIFKDITDQIYVLQKVKYTAEITEPNTDTKNHSLSHYIEWKSAFSTHRYQLTVKDNLQGFIHYDVTIRRNCSL